MKKLLLVIAMILASYGAKANETRRKVVVIDTGIFRQYQNKPYMCKGGIQTVLSKGDQGFDDHGHGTNIIGLIAKKMDSKKYCIVSIRSWSTKLTYGEVFKASVDSIALAAKFKPVFVNISMAGLYNSIAEFEYIKDMINKGTRIAVAAGNDNAKVNSDITCEIFPACYKNALTPKLRKKFYVISSHTTSMANKGNIVDHYFDGNKKGFPKMSGTSQSTAIFTSTQVSK